MCCVCLMAIFLFLLRGVIFSWKAVVLLLHSVHVFCCSVLALVSHLSCTARIDVTVFESQSIKGFYDVKCHLR